jgi:hypothetical protein
MTAIGAWEELSVTVTSAATAVDDPAFLYYGENRTHIAVVIPAR